MKNRQCMLSESSLVAPSYSHTVMKLKHWHLFFHIFYPTSVFTDTDKGQKMSTPTVRMYASTKGSNEAGKEGKKDGKHRGLSYLERTPRVCEQGRSYYPRGWWEFGAESPLGAVGVERCGGNYACQSQRTPERTPHTAELTGPGGQTQEDTQCVTIMSISAQPVSCGIMMIIGLKKTND